MKTTQIFTVIAAARTRSEKQVIIRQESKHSRLRESADLQRLRYQTNDEIVDEANAYDKIHEYNHPIVFEDVQPVGEK